MDAAEDLAVTIDGDVVVFFEAINEVISVGLADNFDAEVVNNKVENGGAGDVTEKTGRVAGWNVSVVCKVFDQFNVCESSGLGKTVHTSTDFSKDSIVFYEWSEIVFIHDIIWDGPGGDVEVLVLAGVIQKG